MLRALIGFIFVSLLATAASAQGSYQIKSGDTLQVEVLEDPTLSRTVLVLPDGTISFPLVGTLQAGGRSVDSVRSALSSGLASNFASPPTVFVSVAALSPPTLPTAAAVAPTIDAFIMGEVTAPGKKAVTPGTTILQFLAEAGGPTKFAASKRIQLRRADKKTGEIRTYLFDYLGTSGENRISGNTALAAGDVVVVPQRRLFE